MNVASNNKRIAKNTMLLYLRLILTMLVSLYTSRVVLDTLGVVDFGIYNVVGGIVTMFGFLNGSMSTTTQRYITIELGRGNMKQLHKVFNTCQIILGALSVLIIILAETVGLWFLYNKMQIPTDRMEASLWVYQTSVAAAVIMLMSVPYNATIIAHERMSAFAYISILEVGLKLVLVYLLLVFSIDKLKLYSFLMLLVQLLIRLVYNIYCSKHFKETSFKLYWDLGLIREMVNFTGWNLFGNIACIAYTQGINILLNMFFGPVVNAARGISVQVQNAINQISTNFQMALNPQITKLYAVGDYVGMHKLICRSSKFSFLLLLLISLPVMVGTHDVLTIWLKEVPEYSSVFLRLMIVTTFIDSVANPLMVAASSTGKVKLYQSVIGFILLLILPISYVVLKLGGNPQSVFIVHVAVCIVAFVVRLFIVRSMIGLRIGYYAKEALLKCFIVTCIALPLPMTLRYMLPEGIPYFFVICILCIISVSLSIYMFGLDKSEKSVVVRKVKSILLIRNDKCN